MNPSTSWRSKPARPVAFLLCALTAGCVGEIDTFFLDKAQQERPEELPSTPGDPADPDAPRPDVEAPEVDDPEPHAPGHAEWRRLSPYEVHASTRDLFVALGAPIEVDALPLASPDVRHQFSNRQDDAGVTRVQLENTMAWSEEVSLRATSDLTTLLGCEPAAAWDACTSEFTERLVGLAWRRPVDSEDLQLFERVYIEVAGEFDATTAVRALIEVALQAPDFWYLSAETIEGGVALKAHALASRLAYTLWGTMPDPELLTEAAAGQLATPEQVRQVAERMLDDERAQVMSARFHREWLHLKSARSLSKNAEIYPGYDEALIADLDESFDRLSARVTLQGGSIEEIFSGRFGYLTPSLAPLYGLEEAVEQPWLWSDLGEERAGVFTHPLFLANTAGAGESSLIHRGVAIMERALCMVLEPPDDVSDEAAMVDPDASSGKLAGVANRAAKSQCSACHVTIDPLGLAFESYDAIGAHRATYPDGVAIDPSGRLLGGHDIAFEGAPQLMREIARTDVARRCYAAKWFEWTTGHGASTPQELASVARLADNATIRELILEIVSSPTFTQHEER